MSKNQETVVQRFWSRVFTNSLSPAIAVPNHGPAPAPIVMIAPAGMGAAVVHPEKPSHVYLNWLDSGRRVAAIMQFLSDNGFKKGDRAAILSWNCPEWVWADFAIQSLGGVTVPIYPNSGADQVNYVLKDSGASVIFGQDQTQLAKVDSASLMLKVSFEEPKVAAPATATFPSILRTTDCKPVLARIKDELAVAHTKPFLGIVYNDVATFIYTSGSTGMPKGVVLTHGNFATECESITRLGITMDDGDMYLSYLPLAHVYERINGMATAIWNGVPVAFCKVEEVGDALKQVHPTVLVGVPAVWRKMKDKMESQMSKATGLKAKLIRWAFAQKKGTFKYWLADQLVFGKVREGLGGRLRLLMSGGAPISPEILHFFDQVGLKLLQGYGLTETSGGLSVNTPDGNKIGSVSRVIDACTVRIVPEPGAAAGDTSGEIWVRGTTVFSQYWNLQAETSKSLDSDGWFKTGDLGRLDSDGYLYITGRKKRLLKTEGGKYVAPEKIEKAFDGDAIVAYVVPVGDGKPFISSLVFVNQQAAAELLKRKGVTVDTANPAAFIAAHPDVNAAVKAAVDTANAKLEHWETVKKFTIVADEATVANGLLTATLKIRTEEAMKRYAALVDAFYVKPKA